MIARDDDDVDDGMQNTENHNHNIRLQTPLHRKPNATDPDDHHIHMEYNTCEI